jgi:hypothetical protein
MAGLFRLVELPSRRGPSPNLDRETAVRRGRLLPLRDIVALMRSVAGAECPNDIGQRALYFAVIRHSSEPADFFEQPAPVSPSRSGAFFTVRPPCKPLDLTRGWQSKAAADHQLLTKH